MGFFRYTILPAMMTVLTACSRAGSRVSLDNPAFPVTPELRDLEFRRMKADPTGLPRPLVILFGYRQPSIGTTLVKQACELTGANPREILTIDYPLSTNIEKIAQRVVKEVDQRWPSDDAEATVPVDVIGVSMGGIVARLAALPVDADPGKPKRLHVVRLFTLASPHRGSRRAEQIAPDAAARALRGGSPLLTRLEEARPTADYELVCYAHLRDHVVGATRTAPPGMEPIWTKGTYFMSHRSIGRDNELLCDLFRRLRGEQPFVIAGTTPPRD